MLLGCIADDVTGATDLSLMLTREGLRTVQSTGLPDPSLDLSQVDALVIALKSRSVPAVAAVDISLQAAQRLCDLGAQRLFFKYCSTFDSTDAGNIGAVAEALLRFVDEDRTIACPAFPRAGRTVYAGHLFVNGVLLSESPMKDHPLNPMRDADLRRVLARQTSLGVGLVGYREVEAGRDEIVAALAREVAAGRAISIVDAVDDRQLRTIGAALSGLTLLTGGSGLAMGLPAAYRDAGLLKVLTPPPMHMATPAGREVILVGSCSTTTRNQIAVAIAAGIPAFQVEVEELASGALGSDNVLGWAERQEVGRPIMIYSSAEPAIVQRAQARLGPETAGSLVETLLAATAQGLVQRGFTRMLVAGGETSGAVVQALDASALAIGPEIDAGVPWTSTLGGLELALALKSGNFGAPDFFLRAWSLLS